MTYSDKETANYISIVVNENTTQEVKKIAKYDLFLQFLVLMSSYIVYIRNLTGKNKIIVYFPLLQENSIGDFFYKLKIDYNKDITFKQFLFYIRSIVISCMEDYNVIELNNNILNEDEDSSDIGFIFSLNELHGNIDINKFKSQRILFTEFKEENKCFLGTFFAGSDFQINKLLENLDLEYNHIINSLICDKEILLNTFENLLEKKVENTIKVLSGPIINISECNIIKMLYEITIKFPAKTALVINNEEYSYQQLWNRIHAISSVLKQNHYQEVIGIYGDYSFNMIACIFAVMKSNNTYLPLDETMPIRRIETALTITNCKAIIGNAKLIPKILMDKIYIYDYCNINNSSEKEEIPEILPNSTAYVIFTSGTTGEPKAIPIQYKGLYNFVKWKISEYSMNENCVCLQILSFLFDAFGANLFPTLLSGGKMVMINHDKRDDYAYIGKLIDSKSITNMNLVPGQYTQILNSIGNNKLKCVKYVILGGECIGREVIEKSNKIKEDIIITNEYGPSENTITTTFCKDVNVKNRLLIGVPIPNNQLYIMNKDYQPIPFEMEGELCIDSIGVTVGYLGKEKEGFIYYNNKRLYKTGDIVRVNHQGQLKYIRRVDNQISLNGYRIDIEEIENVFRELQFIKDAVVIMQPDKLENLYLCAYIQKNGDINISIEFIIEKLKEFLPDYMIPKKYFEVETIPLTKNGKKDRKAILNSNNIKLLSQEYIQATTQTEKSLEEMWKSILSLDKISITDNFFTIGGNSLLVMELHNLVEEHFHKKISIPDMFTYYTIQSMASYIDKLNSKETDNVKIIGAILQDRCFLDDTSNNEEALVDYLSKENNEKLVHPKYIIDNFIDELLKYSKDNSLFAFIKQDNKSNFYVYKYQKIIDKTESIEIKHININEDLYNYNSYLINGEFGVVIPIQEYMKYISEEDRIYCEKIIKLTINNNPYSYQLILESDSSLINANFLEDILLKTIERSKEL